MFDVFSEGYGLYLFPQNGLDGVHILLRHNEPGQLLGGLVADVGGLSGGIHLAGGDSVSGEGHVHRDEAGVALYGGGVCTRGVGAASGGGGRVSLLAADALFITPSAVIQQINALERDLDIRLLNRTSRGTTLTPAGELLRREGTKLVEQSRHIRRELAALEAREGKEIRVGTTLLLLCRVFYDLWNQFTEGSGTTYQVTIKDITSQSSMDLIDLLEGVSWGRDNPFGMEFLELTQVPLVCAVWEGHSLAKRPLLHYEDMRDQTLVTVDSPRFSDSLQALRQEAETYGVRVLPVESYDLPLFSMCAANGYLLQIPQCWQDIHSQLVPVPCAWNYTLPYGFFYQKDPTPLVRRFLRFVEERLKVPDFSMEFS